ncbi:MAG TPA: hypothetical protein VJU17_12555 [Gemmatimonadales bacterium]|nr:hypothetical protein [Gemmatimonadales bacterium]
MNHVRRLAIGLGLLASASRGFAAQAPAQPEHWRITFTPYVWMSGLEGTIGVGSNISDVDVSFTEGAEDFEFGFAGLLEGRRHPWVLRTDFFYVSLSDEEAASGGSTLTVGQDELMLHPEVGYTLLARPWGGVDGLIGARYWNLGVDLSVPPQGVSSHRNWIDGTVGFNLRYQPGENWRLVAKADAGAGGSNFIWQLYGGAGYDVGRCCALVAAWRYLDVDYDKQDLVYDVRLSGPTLGVTLRF